MKHTIKGVLTVEIPFSLSHAKAKAAGVTTLGKKALSSAMSIEDIGDRFRSSLSEKFGEGELAVKPGKVGVIVIEEKAPVAPKAVKAAKAPAAAKPAKATKKVAKAAKTVKTVKTAQAQPVKAPAKRGRPKKVVTE